MDFDELGVSIFEQDKLVEVSSSTEFEAFGQKGWNVFFLI